MAPPSEKRFNWFLCSKHYKDPKTGLFVAEIEQGTRFYEESTGKTFAVPLEKKAVLWVLNDEVMPSIEKVKEYGYQGFTKLRKCDLSSKAADEFMICKEAEFYFLPETLGSISPQKEKDCPIIAFSKRNNNCIRRKVPDFPTPEEIDNVLETYRCSTVCRVLYDYIYLYLSKL